MVEAIRGASTRAALVAALTAGLACDPAPVISPGATLQKLGQGLAFLHEGKLDGILDGLEGRTYKLVIRGRDTSPADPAGGLDPTASNLHLQLLGHLPGDPAQLADPSAPVARLCAELKAILELPGVNTIAPTAQERAQLAAALCTRVDGTIDGLLAAGGDLDRFLEREIAPALKGKRNDGKCKQYDIDTATLEFTVRDVELTPVGPETLLSLRIEDPSIVVSEGTYRVRKGKGSGQGGDCGEESLAGARLRIDGRLDLTFRARASDEIAGYPWPEACGKPLHPYTSPPEEAETVPRDLAHGHLALALDTRAQIDRIELDSQGMLIDWAVQYALNNTRRVACAFAGVAKDKCTRDTEAARTIELAGHDTIVRTWGAVVEKIRWETVGDQRSLKFDARAGLDPDQDKIFTGLDNCPNLANPDQQDTDYDGVGDPCDPVAGDPKVYMAELQRQQMLHCGLMNLSDTFDPKKVYPQLDRRLADPQILGVKQFWRAQARDYGFDWSMVVIDEQPDKMFLGPDQALEFTRRNLEILADRWKLPALRQLPLRVIQTGPHRRVGLDTTAKLPPLSSYQRAMLELALPDRPIQ